MSKNTFYIRDKTIRDDKNQYPVLAYDTHAGIIKHLEGCVGRMWPGKTRVSFMNELLDLGHGDDTDHHFYNVMTDYVETGVVRADGQPMRCNIYEATQFIRKGGEYGD